MPSIVFLRSFVYFWLLLNPQVTSAQDELWEAARRGDASRVQALLADGVDVNAGTRYGATALSFAADKGHTEVVRLLIRHGAEVNSKDSFYQATPLTWALGNGHSEIARLLLENGADGANQALLSAVGRGDEALLKAALATGEVDADALGTALRRAREAGKEDLVALLEEAGARVVQEAPEIAVPSELLQAYAGTYRNEDLGMSVQVSVQDRQLVVQASGQPSLAMKATGQTSFRAVEIEGLNVSFGGRSGMVERMILSQRGENYVFARVDPDAEISPAAAEGSEDTAGAPTPLPRTEPLNWPSFRGPQASGIGDGQGIPSTWDVERGVNVRWKTPIPGIATSSPIIWGDRVFVTTAVSQAGDATFRTGLYGDVASVDDLSPHAWKVYALDKATGKIVWERTAYEGVPRLKRHTKSSQANSTPATDGKRVVALFGSIGGLFCYDVEGSLLWKQDLGALDSGWFYDPDYQWGHASSPVIHGDRVIVQADVQKGSFLAAFELVTGNEVWRASRDEIPTWGTPTVYEGSPRPEVITNGTRIRAYDPLTGKLLWWMGPNSEITVATPVVAHGLVFVTAGYPPVRPIYAIRPGGSGDLSLPGGRTSSEWVVWSNDREGTYIPTPIVYGDQLYTLANNGRLVSYRARTGELVYRARVGGTGGSYAASPLAADGRLFFASETGEVHVVRAGPRYQELARNEMQEVCMATPAISDGLLVIRTLNHLYGIGEPAGTDRGSGR